MNTVVLLLLAFAFVLVFAACLMLVAMPFVLPISNRPSGRHPLSCSKEPPDQERLDERESNIKRLAFFAEGDYFPLREKRIKFLLTATADHIVFLDANGAIEWSQAKEVEPASDHGSIIAELLLLQELSYALLSRRGLHFRYVLASGLTQSLEGDSEGAWKTLRAARARLAEVARFLYLSGAVLTALIFGTLGLLLWAASFIDPVLRDDGGFQVLLAGCVAVTGALASVFLKKDHTVLSSLTYLYLVDGASRILLGFVSGVIAALALKADIMGGFLAVEGEVSLARIIGVCALAGAIERFVPQLVARRLEEARPSDE